MSEICVITAVAECLLTEITEDEGDIVNSDICEIDAVVEQDNIISELFAVIEIGYLEGYLKGLADVPQLLEVLEFDFQAV